MCEGRNTYPVNRENVVTVKLTFKEGQTQMQKGATQVRAGCMLERPGVHPKSNF